MEVCRRVVGVLIDNLCTILDRSSCINTTGVGCSLNTFSIIVNQLCDVVTQVNGCLLINVTIGRVAFSTLVQAKAGIDRGGQSNPGAKGSGTFAPFSGVSYGIIQRLNEKVGQRTVP